MLNLHAPNIHSGGGEKLLQDLLRASARPACFAQLDARLNFDGNGSDRLSVCRIRPSLSSRLIAELRLSFISKPEDITLCFNGLPPLFPIRGRVFVFIQNRLLLSDVDLSGFPLKTKLRLLAERVWLRLAHRSNNNYIVQSRSMQSAACVVLGEEAKLSILPFVTLQSIESQSSDRISEYDFVYVASGEKHKNHKNLIRAWCQLADFGLRPSLALTLDPLRYSEICSEMEILRDRYQLNIVNLGWLPAKELPSLYQCSRALVFPSLAESFGLPLLEADMIGVPILASELDYVRDVVNPVETFDPTSPISIARAVMRFTGSACPRVDVLTADEFWREVMK